MIRQTRSLAHVLITLAALLAVSGCAGPPVVLSTLSADSIELRRLAQLPLPITLTANTPREASDIASTVTATRLAQLKERNGTRLVEGTQIPYFFTSAAGRAYLAATGASGRDGRALARGTPAETCPVQAQVLGEPNAAAAAEAALGQCLSALRQVRATKTAVNVDDCGCQLLAAGDVLFEDASAYVHAQAVTAHIVGPARGQERVLIAEEGESIDPTIRPIVLRDLRGLLGTIDMAADGRATLFWRGRDGVFVRAGQ
ncbi:MAG: hypothetical protein AAFV62_03035, partial [Pseudomonadota bacterium]